MTELEKESALSGARLEHHSPAHKEQARIYKSKYKKAKCIIEDLKKELSSANLKITELEKNETRRQVEREKQIGSPDIVRGLRQQLLVKDREVAILKQKLKRVVGSIQKFTSSIVNGTREDVTWSDSHDFSLSTDATANVFSSASDFSEKLGVASTGAQNTRCEAEGNGSQTKSPCECGRTQSAFCVDCCTSQLTSEHNRACHVSRNVASAYRNNSMTKNVTTVSSSNSNLKAATVNDESCEVRNFSHLSDADASQIEKDMSLGIVQSGFTQIRPATVLPKPNDVTSSSSDVTFSVTSDATLTVTSDYTLPVISNATFSVTSDITLPITSNATLPVTNDITLPVTRDATLPITNDGTLHTGNVAKRTRLTSPCLVYRVDTNDSLGISRCGVGSEVSASREQGRHGAPRSVTREKTPRLKHSSDTWVFGDTRKEAMTNGYVSGVTEVNAVKRRPNSQTDMVPLSLIQSQNAENYQNTAPLSVEDSGISTESQEKMRTRKSAFIERQQTDEMRNAGALPVADKHPADLGDSRAKVSRTLREVIGGKHKSSLTSKRKRSSQESDVCPKKSKMNGDRVEDRAQLMSNRSGSPNLLAHESTNSRSGNQISHSCATNKVVEQGACSLSIYPNKETVEGFANAVNVSCHPRAMWITSGSGFEIAMIHSETQEAAPRARAQNEVAGTGVENTDVRADVKNAEACIGIESAAACTVVENAVVRTDVENAVALTGVQNEEARNSAENAEGLTGAKNTESRINVENRAARTGAENADTCANAENAESRSDVENAVARIDVEKAAAQKENATTCTVVENEATRTGAENAEARIGVEKGVVCTDVDNTESHTDTENASSRTDVKEAGARTDIQNAAVRTDVENAVARTDLENAAAGSNAENAVVSIDVENTVACIIVENAETRIDEENAEFPADTKNEEALSGDENAVVRTEAQPNVEKAVVCASVRNVIARASVEKATCDTNKKQFDTQKKASNLSDQPSSKFCGFATHTDAQGRETDNSTILEVTERNPEPRVEKSSAADRRVTDNEEILGENDAADKVDVIQKVSMYCEKFRNINSFNNNKRRPKKQPFCEAPVLQAVKQYSGVARHKCIQTRISLHDYKKRRNLILAAQHKGVYMKDVMECVARSRACSQVERLSAEVSQPQHSDGSDKENCHDEPKPAPAAPSLAKVACLDFSVIERGLASFAHKISGAQLHTPEQGRIEQVIDTKVVKQSSPPKEQRKTEAVGKTDTGAVCGKPEGPVMTEDGDISKMLEAVRQLDRAKTVTDNYLGDLCSIRTTGDEAAIDTVVSNTIDVLQDVQSKIANSSPRPAPKSQSESKKLQALSVNFENGSKKLKSVCHIPMRGSSIIQTDSGSKTSDIQGQRSLIRSRPVEIPQEAVGLPLPDPRLRRSKEDDKAIRLKIIQCRDPRTRKQTKKKNVSGSSKTTGVATGAKTGKDKMERYVGEPQAGSSAERGKPVLDKRAMHEAAATRHVTQGNAPDERTCLANEGDVQELAMMMQLLTDPVYYPGSSFLYQGPSPALAEEAMILLSRGVRPREVSGVIATLKHDARMSAENILPENIRTILFKSPSPSSTKPTCPDSSADNKSGKRHGKHQTSPLMSPPDRGALLRSIARRRQSQDAKTYKCNRVHLSVLLDQEVSDTQDSALWNLASMAEDVESRRSSTEAMDVSHDSFTYDDIPHTSFTDQEISLDFVHFVKNLDLSSMLDKSHGQAGKSIFEVGLPDCDSLSQQVNTPLSPDRLEDNSHDTDAEKGEVERDTALGRAEGETLVQTAARSRSVCPVDAADENAKDCTEILPHDPIFKVSTPDSVFDLEQDLQLSEDESSSVSLSGAGAEWVQEKKGQAVPFAGALLPPRQSLPPQIYDEQHSNLIVCFSAKSSSQDRCKNSSFSSSPSTAYSTSSCESGDDMGINDNEDKCDSSKLSEKSGGPSATEKKNENLEMPGTILTSGSRPEERHLRFCEERSDEQEAAGPQLDNHQVIFNSFQKRSDTEEPILQGEHLLSPLKNFKSRLSPKILQSAAYSLQGYGESRMDDDRVMDDGPRIDDEPRMSDDVTVDDSQQHGMSDCEVSGDEISSCGNHKGDGADLSMSSEEVVVSSPASSGSSATEGQGFELSQASHASFEAEISLLPVGDDTFDCHENVTVETPKKEAALSGHSPIDKEECRQEREASRRRCARKQSAPASSQALRRASPRGRVKQADKLKGHSCHAGSHKKTAITKKRVFKSPKKSVERTNSSNGKKDDTGDFKLRRDVTALKLYQVTGDDRFEDSIASDCEGTNSRLAQHDPALDDVGSEATPAECGQWASSAYSFGIQEVSLEEGELRDSESVDRAVGSTDCTTEPSDGKDTAIASKPTQRSGDLRNKMRKKRQMRDGRRGATRDSRRCSDETHHAQQLPECHDLGDGNHGVCRHGNVTRAGSGGPQKHHQAADSPMRAGRSRCWQDDRLSGSASCDQSRLRSSHRIASRCVEPGDGSSRERLECGSSRGRQPGKSYDTGKRRDPACNRKEEAESPDGHRRSRAAEAHGDRRHKLDRPHGQRHRGAGRPKGPNNSQDCICDGSEQSDSPRSRRCVQACGPRIGRRSKSKCSKERQHSGSPERCRERTLSQSRAACRGHETTTGSPVLLRSGDKEQINTKKLRKSERTSRVPTTDEAWREARASEKGYRPVNRQTRARTNRKALLR